MLRVRGSGDGHAVEDTVKAILRDVKENGDTAVLKYTRKFDDSAAVRLRISPAEMTKYAAKADPKVVRALEISAKRIRKFHKMQTERSWSFSEGETILGQSIRPLNPSERLKDD